MPQISNSVYRTVTNIKFSSTHIINPEQRAKIPWEEFCFAVNRAL
jgi:hypothetical protein